MNDENYTVSMSDVSWWQSGSLHWSAKNSAARGSVSEWGWWHCNCYYSTKSWCGSIVHLILCVVFSSFPSASFVIFTSTILSTYSLSINSFVSCPSVWSCQSVSPACCLNPARHNTLNLKLWKVGANELVFLTHLPRSVSSTMRCNQFDCWIGHLFGMALVTIGTKTSPRHTLHRSFRRVPCLREIWNYNQWACLVLLALLVRKHSGIGDHRHRYPKSRNLLIAEEKSRLQWSASVAVFVGQIDRLPQVSRSTSVDISSLLCSVVLRFVQGCTKNVGRRDTSQGTIDGLNCSKVDLSHHSRRWCFAILPVLYGKWRDQGR